MQTNTFRFVRELLVQSTNDIGVVENTFVLIGIHKYQSKIIVSLDLDHPGKLNYYVLNESAPTHIHLE